MCWEVLNRGIHLDKPSQQLDRWMNEHLHTRVLVLLKSNAPDLNGMQDLPRVDLLGCLSGWIGSDVPQVKQMLSYILETKLVGYSEVKS